MKVLYIDTDCHTGHINFNNIYIRALQQRGIEIDLILRKGYIEKLGLMESMLLAYLPEWMYVRGKNGRIKSRLFMMARLFYLRYKFPFESYDYVFFSSYEEISFYFSGLKASNIILINHRNVAGLDSRMKCFFLKKISSRIQYHIVFEEYMKIHYIQKGICNVEVVSHGLPQSYCRRFEQVGILERLIPDLSSYRYVIFSPSSSSSDTGELEKLIHDNVFIEYLKKNKIILVIKGQFSNGNKGNIRILDTYLNQEEYEMLFLRSDLIFICYPHFFDFCVSAVLFECISNNKPCVVSDIRALRVFGGYMNYDCFFTNLGQLTDCIDGIIHSPQKEWYHQRDLLQPGFDFLFSVHD